MTVSSVGVLGSVMPPSAAAPMPENRPAKASCQTPKASGSTCSTKRLLMMMWAA